MYRVSRKNDVSEKELRHSGDIFLTANKENIALGHVISAPYGDYDISYVDNMELVPENYRKNKKGIELYPSYKSYTTDNPDYLELSIIEEHGDIFFECVNEYTIEVAKLALKYTKNRVWFHDELIYNFIEPEDRLVIAETFPEKELKEKKSLHVVDGFVSGYIEGNYDTISSMPLFHSIFFLQALTENSLDDIRYVRIGVTKSVGIGGVLSYYAEARRTFSDKGWITYLAKNASRYPDELLHKYFSFADNPTDSDESNTIFIEDYTKIALTYYGFNHSGEIDTSILSDEFRKEMEEYANAVLEGHSTLGVLIRGTDYIVSNMSGSRKMATVDDMLPLIHEWINEDGYDRIFLATEDQDILDRMKEEFGTKLIAISQIRHRVSDFVGVRLISELEEKNSGDDYNAILEDDTVNYFYALYILSKCDSLMVSGHCHGWNVANSFKEGEYKRRYKFMVGVTK